jgi:hypothetical protein
MSEDISPDDRLERTGSLYERPVYRGDVGAVTAADRELDGVEADSIVSARSWKSLSAFVARSDS